MYSSNLRFSAALLVVGASSLSQSASLFIGDAFWSILPNTDMGTSVNQLGISNGPGGFMVAGQFAIGVPGGVSSGTLLNYQVKRLLNPTFGSQWMSLYTMLVGFSAPPFGGTFAPTSGYCRTYLDVSGWPAGTNLNLVNGAATWNSNIYGQTFNYTSGTDVYLVQDFWLDGSKLSGPAGPWVVDLPVESAMIPVPEPATMAALGLGWMAVWRRRTTGAPALPHRRKAGGLGA